MDTETYKNFSGPLERTLARASDAFIAAGYPLLFTVWTVATQGRTAQERLRALGDMSLEIKASDEAAIALRNFLMVCGAHAKDQPVFMLEVLTETLDEVLKMASSPEAVDRRQRCAQYMIRD